MCQGTFVKRNGDEISVEVSGLTVVSKEPLTVGEYGVLKGPTKRCGNISVKVAEELKNSTYQLERDNKIR